MNATPSATRASRPATASLARFGARLAMLAALALPLGCVNPFKPADPETGGSGSQVVENFKTPEDLLDTIKQAIEAKSGGATAYLHAFADSTQAGDRAFRAIYDPAVKLGWEGGSPQPAPEPWNLEFERGLHNYLGGIRQQDTYTFKFTADSLSGNDELDTENNIWLLHRKYLLLSKSPTSGSDTQGEIIGIGFCDLSLLSRDSRWAIFRWVDRVDPAVGVNPAATDQRTFTWWRLKSM